MADRLLITGGNVVSLDHAVGALAPADVLIENGILVAVGRGIQCEDCERIDASQSVVLPGLVDSHRHLWYAALRGCAMDQVHAEMRADVWPRFAVHFRPEDVYNCARAAAAECLNAGITCVLDWCHVINSPDHAVAAVDALRSMPIRAIFGYGVSMRHKLAELTEGPQEAIRWDHARSLMDSGMRGVNGLLSMALALQGPEATSWENSVADIAAARQMGLPMTMHVGIPQGLPSGGGVARLHAGGLLGPDMNFVHCNSLTQEEIHQIGASGATVSVTPMAELALGMGVPPVGRFKRAGIAVSLGADAVCAASGDLFDEARTALLIERCLAAQVIYARGQSVALGDDLGFSTADALSAITVEGARACWQAATAGSLTPGKQADLVLIRVDDVNLAPMRDPIATIVGCAHAGNIDTVVVAGRVAKRGGRLVGIDTAAIGDALVATREHLAVAASRRVA